MDDDLAELVEDARRLASAARAMALWISHDPEKREWERIAALWDEVAEGYEQLKRQKATRH